MVFMVGNIRIAIEIETNGKRSQVSRAERIYRDVLTERHFDEVRTTAMRRAMLAGLR